MEKGSAPIILLISAVVVISAILIATQTNYLQNLTSKPETPQTSVSQVIKSPTPVPTIDPTANWKTYTDSQGLFTLQYPTNVSITKDDKWTTIIPKGIVDVSKNFFATIKVIKNSNVTLDQLKKNPLQYTGFRYGTRTQDSKVVQDSIKKYENGQINGIRYQVDYDNGDQSAPYEEITVINNNYIYVFDLTNPSTGQLVQEEGQKSVDQILQTFKFTDAGGDQAVDTSAWKTYSDQKRKISFKYPLEATVSNGKAYSMLSFDGSDTIQINKPYKYVKDSGYIINIVVNDNPADTPAKTIIDTFISKVEKDCSPPGCSLPHLVRKTLKEYSNGDVNGYMFHIGAETDSVMVVQVHKKSTYIYRVTGENGYATDQGIKVFDQILSTFKFTN